MPNKSSKKIRVLLCILIFIIVGGGILYLVSSREINQLDDGTRSKLCSAHVLLTDGVTCYEIGGPVDGPPIVLVHGATIPSWDFDPQFDALVSGGFRVLRYDMLGRGFSDRPKVAYTRSLYLRQLRELLEQVGMHQPVTLVGHSFGGAISIAFAARYPKRVSKAVLIAPVINSVNAKAPFIVARFPLLDKFLVRMVMVGAVQKRAQEQYKLSKLDVQHYDQLFYKQTTYEGFEYALESMFETDAIGDYRGDYQKVGASQIPVMMVWGDKDKDITKDVIEEVKGLMPGLHFQKFDGVSHAPNIEAPVKFNQLVVKFLESNN